MIRLLSNWLGRVQPATPPAPKRVEPEVNFAAVEIRQGLFNGCQAIAKQEGTRYLMHEAPSIPLAGCDASECQCKYVRLKDRRQERRRDADYGIAQQGVLTTERRGLDSGRREADQ